MNTKEEKSKENKVEESKKVEAEVKKTEKTKAVSKGKNSIPKLRIRARAYEQKLLDASIKQIIDTAIRYEVKVSGPIPLPTEMRRYTVNRASFVFKDSREQFEMRVHKRLIDIIEPSPKVVEALSNLNLPSGVSIEVKMM